MQAGLPQSSQSDFSLPSGPDFLHGSSQRRPWQSPVRKPSTRSGKSSHVSQHVVLSGASGDAAHQSLSREQSTRSPAPLAPDSDLSPSGRKWWRIRLFRGMINDVKRRAPFYWSDWTEAWDYRVVPATVYMYFANILPALAFSLDMFEKTHQSYGVNEVLLASVLGSVVFSLFAAQPLVIVGVTGPITVFNYTVYDIIAPRGTNYLAFMAWIGIWSLIMHWFLAITNACNGLTYVTRFSCDIFGFYVAFIYLQKGIQVLTRQWGADGETSAYLSIMVALLVLMSGYVCSELGQSTLFFQSRPEVLGGLRYTPNHCLLHGLHPYWSYEGCSCCYAADQQVILSNC